MKHKKRQFKSVIAQDIIRFLDYKRALARRYDVEEKALYLFDSFLMQCDIGGTSQITPEIIDAFLASRSRKKPRSYNHLLGTVRRLFAWLVLQGLLPVSPVHAKSRRQNNKMIPFIFDQKAAKRLLECAAGLANNPKAPLRGITYQTIFALLYGLGLRVGEVSRLCYNDIDFERRLLIIRQTKFSKDRLVPFGSRIGSALETYLQVRQQHGASLSPSSPVFSFVRGQAINPGTISLTFHSLVPRLRLQIPDGVSSPRLHHLRHSFTVYTLLRWYRSGINPQSRLIYLSTFLGHVSPESTAVYLTIGTELLNEANCRFEQFASETIKEND